MVVAGAGLDVMVVKMEMVSCDIRNAIDVIYRLLWPFW